MDPYISPDDAAKWRRLADKLKTISELVTDCHVIALLELGITEGRPRERIEALSDASSGLSYLFTPQTEWMGGDSTSPDNYKVRLPHIASL